MDDHVPGLQPTQTVENEFEYVAAAQSLHVLAPDMFENVPGAHVLQELIESDTCNVENVPGPQRTQRAEVFDPITVEYCPGPHPTQAVKELAPIEIEKVPAGQDVQKLAPESEKVP